MITGQMFRDGVISAANNIANSRQAVDALNIFPVPDGDTGTNMSMTIASASDDIKDMPDNSTIGDVSKRVASALLRGARGNSGVILSLIFRGFSKAFKGVEQADGDDVARAFRMGSDAAYKAVMKPTEGTILTVVRCAAEAAEEMAKINNDTLEVCTAALEAAKEALAKTPEMLPVLKQAGVVDAGGQGFLLILQGMKSVIVHNAIVSPVGEEAMPSKKTGSAEQAEVGYDCAFIIQKERGAKESDAIKLRAFLEAIGNGVEVNEDGNKISVKVVSEQLGSIIQTAVKYGQLFDISIKNLSEPNDEADKKEDEPKIAEPENDYGFVSVCAGEGLTELFSDLGADVVVSGGQTMNPSTDDIINAVLAVPAKVVYVLPNNKNIIMAAQMARDSVTDREVIVLETKTIPQGICAMLAFDETVGKQENLDAMLAMAGNVQTASVTFAARDSEVDGKPIKEGQIMGLCNGAIKFIGENREEIAFKATAELFNPDENNLVTLIYGEDTTEEEAQRVEEMLNEKFASDIEVSIVNGGQPVYYYIISVE